MRCATALSSLDRSMSFTSESTCAGLGHCTMAITPPDAKRRAPTTALVRLCSRRTRPPPPSHTAAPLDPLSDLAAPPTILSACRADVAPPPLPPCARHSLLPASVLA
eukprot:3436559-Prymnesium_polylepis.1